MILLWFILGILLALGIARYNKSNGLFWALATAFVLGYAATVAYTRTFSKQSNDNLTQVCPTQESHIVAIPPTVFYNAVVTPSKVTASNPVSQVYTPEEREKSVTLSEVFGRTRDQPLDYFDTS